MNGNVESAAPIEIDEARLAMVSGGSRSGMDPNGGDAGSFMDPNGGG